MPRATSTWTFTLVLAGVRELGEGVEDALFEAGCDDALLAISSGVVALEFDREAASFRAAVLGAIGDVRRAGLDVTVARVAPDDFVNASDIARRSGVTREAARKWIEGQRGGGDFPPPRANVGSSSVWSWFEVAAWLHQREQLDAEAVDVANTTAVLNRLLDEGRWQGLAEELAALETELAKGRGTRRRRRA